MRGTRRRPTRRAGWGLALLGVCLAAPARGTPTVSFTQAPGCGDGSTPLAGIVRGVPVPADYVIAPYIYSGTIT